MFQRIVIRSRPGNVVLAILGTTYGIASGILFVYYIATTWGAVTMVDRLLQFILLGTAVTGAAFVEIGRENLRRQSH